MDALAGCLQDDKECFDSVPSVLQGAICSNAIFSVSYFYSSLYILFSLKSADYSDRAVNASYGDLS